MRLSPNKALLMDISTINSICTKYLGKDINIFLYGSYGSNQGAWILNDDNEYHPYNDYDILVLKNKLNKKDFMLMQKVEKELLNNIKIKFIDLTLSTNQEMKFLKPTVLNIDILNSSKQIFGKYDFRKQVNNLDKKNISLEEVEKLFFTRLWVFSGAMTNLEKDKTFVLTQIAKAIFAIVDAILIENKQYTSLYENKKNLVKNFVDKDFFNLVCWACEQRSHPSSELNLNDFIDNKKNSNEKFLYKIVCEKYRLVFLRVLGNKYNKSFNSIDEFRSFYNSSIRTKIKRLIYPIVKGKSYNKDIYIRNAFMIKLSLLLSEINDTEGLEMLKNASDFFKINKNICNNICYEIAQNL